MTMKKPQQLTRLEATLIYQDCEEAVAALSKENGLEPTAVLAYLIAFCTAKLAEALGMTTKADQESIRRAIAKSIENYTPTGD